MDVSMYVFLRKIEPGVYLFTQLKGCMRLVSAIFAAWNVAAKGFLLIVSELLRLIILFLRRCLRRIR
jgi:hypothetical protein